MDPTYAVILAGGSGTRFWPASRRARPKQLQALVPGSETSLIAQTVQRIGPLCSPERIFVATSARLLAATQGELPGLPEAAFLGEPVARNTAPAIAWATFEIAARDPDAVVMVLPSDHSVVDEAAFRATLTTALRSAASGVVTTIGIRPTRPETGFGYIEVGDAVEDDVLRVLRFVEKPSRERAETYVASGRHLWNAGMFFFRARQLLDAVDAHLPGLAHGLERLASVREGSAEARALAVRELFESCEATSIDYGIMEKLTTLHVVPGDFGWSDLGSWQAAWELAAADAHGNALEPGTLVADSRRNLVRSLGSQRKRVALVGVEDLCVVQTDDAILVVPRERAQDVKAIVQLLEQQGGDDLL